MVMAKKNKAKKEQSNNKKRMAIDEKLQSPNKKIKTGETDDKPKEVDVSQAFEQLNDVRKLNDEHTKLVSKLIKEVKSDDSKIGNGFKDVLTAFMLHLSANTDESLDCFSEIETSWKSFKKNDVSSELNWADVMVDLIISILPSSGHKCTQIVTRGAKSFAFHVTPAVLGSVQAALESTGHEDSDVDDDGSSAEDSEGDDDVLDEEDENDSAEEDDEEKIKELDEFKMKLHKILNTGIQEDNDEDEDNELDDDQMMALDEALGEAFRERLGQTKKETAKNLIDFKCRVLRLFEALIDVKDTTVELCLPLVLPLIALVRQPSPSNLSSKALSVLDHISKSKPKGDADQEILLKIGKICTQAVISPTTSANARKPLYHVLSWVCKIGGPNVISSESAKIITEIVKTKFANKNCIDKHGMTELCNFPDISAAFVSSFPDVFFDHKTKDSRRCPALEILASALKKLDKTTVEKKILSNLLTRTIESLRGCLVGSEKKPNPLMLSSLLQVLAALKQLTTDQPIDAEIVESLSSLKGKAKKRLPIAGQKALKAVIKG